MGVRVLFVKPGCLPVCAGARYAMAIGCWTPGYRLSAAIPAEDGQDSLGGRLSPNESRGALRGPFLIRTIAHLPPSKITDSQRPGGSIPEAQHAAQHGLRHNMDRHHCAQEAQHGQAPLRVARRGTTWTGTISGGTVQIAARAGSRRGLKAPDSANETTGVEPTAVR